VLHAAPSQSGSADCSTAGNACTIQTAFTNAGDNDEIVLAPGTYGSPPYTAGLSMAKSNVYIHGTRGSPRPQIEFDDGADTPMTITGTGDRLEYLGIHNVQAQGLRLAGNSTAAQVYVRADAAGSTAYTCEVRQGTLIDSVCWKPGDQGAAATTTTFGAGNVSAVYRNVTLVASGAATTGLTVRAFGGYTAEAQAKKKKAKKFMLQAVTVPVAANVSKVISLKLPDKALSALLAGAKESATFSLAATNSHGTGTATASIKHIVHKRKPL
jgi:hypothetical protein